MIAWLMLFCAGIFEIIWVVSFKYSANFTKFWPALITLTSLAASMILLGLAIRNLPMGTAYAIWTGIGAIGVFILGIILFNEELNSARLIFASLIFIGIIGLKFTSPS
jgi:quaternary ammonium compound-resistance protein SugE